MAMKWQENSNTVSSYHTHELESRKNKSVLEHNE